jgi:hypothetical protein
MTEPEGRHAYHAAGRLSRAARDLMQNADTLERPSDSYAIRGNVLDSMRGIAVGTGRSPFYPIPGEWTLIGCQWCPFCQLPPIRT